VRLDHTTLYRYLSQTQHTILLFTGSSPTEEGMKEINQLQKSLENQYPDLIKSYIVHKEQLSTARAGIVDANLMIHESYQVKKPAIYIIRPDTYISYYSEDFNVELVNKFLRTYLY
jgi:hypothetical protein